MRIKLFTFLLLTVMSCSIPIGPSKYSWGSFSAKMNGKVWGQSYPNGFQEIRGHTTSGGTNINQCPEESYWILLEWYNKQGFNREELFLKKIPLKAGKYKVIPFTPNCQMTDPIYAIFYTSIDDGDVLGDTYNLLPTYDNFVQVDNYDNYTKEIRGKFQLTFVVATKAYGHFLPDTLRLTEGSFHTKIK